MDQEGVRERTGWTVAALNAGLQLQLCLQRAGEWAGHALSQLSSPPRIYSEPKPRWAGQRGWAASTLPGAHRDPGCILPWLHDASLQPPSVLDLQLAPRTLSSILHLPHPSHRPLGVSVTPRAVTTQHLPTRHARLCPGALSLSLSHDALRSPPLSW